MTVVDQMLDLPPIELPPEFNYIGVFLAFHCNLNCSYCINDPAQGGDRKAKFGSQVREMSPDQWAAALKRLKLGYDIPITLQGGEPTLYGRGRGLQAVLAQSDHKFDLLTNLALPVDKLQQCIGDQADKLRRDAPYPSIRVSYHRDEMDRAWARDGRTGAEELVERCLKLRDLGFTVSDDKAETDVGIYVVEHPENADTSELAAAAAGNVYVEGKEFLGVHEGKLYGTYRYPFSINLIEAGVAERPLACECRTTELLIDPLGFVWRCHSFVYGAWTTTSMLPVFAEAAARSFDFGRLDLSGLSYRPIGHILDPAFDIATVRTFRPCDQFGTCIGCDTKVKNNRFQSLYDEGVPHTSVEIRGIRMPKDILDRVEADQRTALIAQGVIEPAGKEQSRKVGHAG